ncbi:peroxiredoxin [Nitzschia inconspicua]|uniref:Peroxiredoxin n=1 Tax=Nitzschia inconspicua TaxID=303405 RepID=A0A9K3PFB1_9STRA|nr:peroxiredoxin [Nitzschia inconspicua]
MSPIAALRRSFVSAARGNVAARGVMKTLSPKAPVVAAVNPLLSSLSTFRSLSSSSTMDTMETGTKMYMSLYPEGSTDGSLRLGNIVPDFSADTTHGPMESFHEWKKGKWAILFSHPADFTPVCTTEIGRLAMKYDELKAMDCLVATLSVDPVKSHTEWLRDVVAHCENQIKVEFPIIGDADRSISTAYGMIDPGTSGDQQLPLTIRAVFIINPENKLMLSLNYPACVGRNTDEIVRCVKALQLSYEKSIATPANWPENHADLPLKDGSRTDEFKGSVFLLPTVSPEEAKANYPDYHTCEVPSGIEYLRLVKSEDVEKK